MTLPGLVAANNLSDVVDRERVWDNLGRNISDNFPIAPPSLDLNFAANKSLIDDVSGSNLITFSRASTGTFVGSNGLIQTAASGAPRFDHNPTTGESLGLLIEEARINLIRYSEDLTNVNWSPVNSTVQKETINGPAGTIPYDKIILNTFTSSAGYVRQPITATIGTVYTTSVYVKQGTARYLYLVQQWNNSSGTGAYFDLQTGSYVSGGGLAASETNIVACGNGWYRASIRTTDVGPGGSAGVLIFPMTIPNPFINGSGGREYNSNGEYLYTYGVQTEAGSFATSYIPTTAATVTRAPDVASITGANFSNWYNQNGGTMFIESEKDSSNGIYVGMSNASFQSALLPYRLNSTLTLVSANYNLVNVYRVLNDTPKLKWAIYFSPTAIRESANGNSIESTSAVITTNFDRLSFGSAPWDPGAGVGGSTVFSRFAYWSSRLKDVTLQYITSTSGSASSTTYPYTFSVLGKSMLALNGVSRTSTRDFIFIKGLTATVQPRLNTAASNTASGALLRDFAMPKASPTTIGNYFFSPGVTLSGVSTRINGTPALSIATSPFSGPTATSRIVLRELQPQANWRITEPMVSGTVASPELAIPFETNDFVLFMKAGQN